MCCRRFSLVHWSGTWLWYCNNARVFYSDQRTCSRASPHRCNWRVVLLYRRYVQFRSSNLSWSPGTGLHCDQSSCTGRWPLSQRVTLEPTLQQLLVSTSFLLRVILTAMKRHSRLVTLHIFRFYLTFSRNFTASVRLRYKTSGNC